MVATNWLAKRCLEHAKSMPVDGNSHGHKMAEADSSTRVITKLRATIEASIPVAYEDEAGFHYGADSMD